MRLLDDKRSVPIRHGVRGDAGAGFSSSSAGGHWGWGLGLQSIEGLLDPSGFEVIRNGWGNRGPPRILARCSRVLKTCTWCTTGQVRQTIVRLAGTLVDQVPPGSPD